MKQIKCKVCLRCWYVEDDKVSIVKICPFCKTLVREKKEMKNIDTLSKAIFKIVSECNFEILNSKERFFAYLYDFAPSLNKEIRIFSRVFSECSILEYKKSFKQDLNVAKLTINKLRIQFIEEGLSETWANLICDNCLQAVKYYKGEVPEDIHVEINDEEFIKKTADATEKIYNDMPNDVFGLSSFEDLYKINNLENIYQKEQSEYILNFPKVNLSLKSIGLYLGGSIKFGHNSKGKSITWIVLDADKDKLLLFYKEEDLANRYNFGHNTWNEDWSNCSLRRWMNETFYNSAFSDNEKEVISEVNGDKVFCLSKQELIKYSVCLDMKKPFWLTRDKVACIDIKNSKYDTISSNDIAIVKPALYLSKKYFQ